MNTFTQPASSNPLQWALPDKNLKSYPHRCGKLFYRRTPFSYVVAGDPVSETVEGQISIWNDFVKEHSGQSICGYYFTKRFSEKLKESFDVIPSGICSSLDLTSFTIEGRSAKEIRRGCNKGARLKSEICYIPDNKKSEYYPKVKKMEDEWLKWKPLKVYFLLSRLKKKEKSKWLALNIEDKPVAFISYYEKNNEIYIDHMITQKKKVPMAMDMLLSQWIVDLWKVGEVKKLHFGFCALANFKKRDSLVEIGLFLFKKMSFIYSFDGIYAFKKKYSSSEEGCFLVLQKKQHIKQAISLLQVTFFNNQ